MPGNTEDPVFVPRLAVIVALTSLVLAPAFPSAAGAPLAEEAVARQIRLRLEHFEDRRPLVVAGAELHSQRVLPSFYERRLYRPIWSDGSDPSPAATELATYLRQVGKQGLLPAHYHSQPVDELLSSLAEQANPAELAALDLLLTDAFLILGAHLVSGRVDPVTFDPEWIAYRREVDLAAALATALEVGTPSRVLEGLLPRHRGYRELQRGLVTLRRIAREGGWPTVDEGPALRPDDHDDRVAQLRARLAVTDSAEAAAGGEATVYDEGLAAAVRRFQARHGLDPDAVVGEKTSSALNVPVYERLRQIELNLERWRWLPQHLGDRHVVVNIPDYSLVVVEEDRQVFTTRVAVGRRYRRTPVFSDNIRYLVLSPFWEVPHRLAIEDKLPEIRKDPYYLAHHGFKVYQGWGADEIQVDPAEVDWSELGAHRFPYRLRQDPGPLNALGRIKFMFPNRFNVYLHDTPGREIFRKPERDVSSGCIRLEHPIELALLLLGPSSTWDRETLERTGSTGRETVVPLGQPVPIHLLYWTAWAGDGDLHFRRDLYGRDALLAGALDKAAALAGTDALAN